MKYEALFNLVKERGDVIFRLADYPEKIVIPAKGYATDTNLDWFLSVPVGDDELWDVAIERAITQNVTGFLRLSVENTTGGQFIGVQPVHVFRSRAYAMGFAACSGSFTAIELATGKLIIEHTKVRSTL